MPKARAPNAPCVLVWLSPQTMVLPGCVAPSSGPMTCTMPRRSSLSPIRSRPNSAQLRSSCADLLRRRLERDRLAAEDLRGVGRRRVVHRHQRAVRAPHLEAAAAQHREGLRRGDFVRSGAGRCRARPACRAFPAPPRGAPRLSRTGSSRSCGVSRSGSDGGGGCFRLGTAGHAGRGGAHRLDAVHHLEEGAHAGLDDVGGDARAAVGAAVVLDGDDCLALGVLAHRTRCAPRTCAASRRCRSRPRWP